MVEFDCDEFAFNVYECNCFLFCRDLLGLRDSVYSERIKINQSARSFFLLSASLSLSLSPSHIRTPHGSLSPSLSRSLALFLFKQNAFDPRRKDFYCTIFTGHKPVLNAIYVDELA